MAQDIAWMQYKSVLHCTLLVIVISICYGHTLNHSFQFDDHPNILEKRALLPEKLSWVEIKPSLYNYDEGVPGRKIHRPVARFSFAINYYFNRFDVRGYHITNILIHILSSIILYFLFKTVLSISTRIIGSSDSRYNIPSPSIADIALLGSILWAIHPINTQAVTYIVQRMASLAALFFFISLLLYFHFRLSNSWAKKALYLSFCLFFWLVAVFTKENTITLPLSIILFEILFFPKNRRTIRYISILTILFAAISVIAFLIQRGNIYQYLSLLYDNRPFTMIERVLTETRILVKYILLLLNPTDKFLSLESDIQVSKGILNPISTLFSILFLFLINIAAILFRKKVPLFSLAILFFLVNHLVESTFIGLELYFEHRNYLPSIFIYLFIAYGAFLLLQYFQRNKRKHMVVFLTSSMTFFLTVEGFSTVLKNDVWQTEKSLLEDSMKKAPESVRPYISYAAQNIPSNLETARDHLKTAHELYKKYPERYKKDDIALLFYNAASLYFYEKKFDKAKAFALESIRLDVDNYKSQGLMGSICWEQKDYKCALTGLQNSLAINAGRLKTYIFLSRVYAQLGDYDIAIKILEDGFENTKESTQWKEISFYNLISYNLHLNRTKIAKQIFFGIHETNRTPLYYLFRIIFSENDDELSKYLSMFCRSFPSGSDSSRVREWIGNIVKNNSLLILYPDIDTFKESMSNCAPSARKD